MNNKYLEQIQLDKLLGRSVKFKIGRFNFGFREPFAYTLDRLSDIAIKLEFDEKKLKESSKEINILKKSSARLIVKYITIFYLEKRWKIFLFGNIVFRYFYSNLRPSDMILIIIQLRAMENDPDFINSIRLIAQFLRTSTPAHLVETQA